MFSGVTILLLLFTFDDGGTLFTVASQTTATLRSIKDDRETASRVRAIELLAEYFLRPHRSKQFFIP